MSPPILSRNGLLLQLWLLPPPQRQKPINFCRRVSLYVSQLFHSCFLQELSEKPVSSSETATSADLASVNSTAPSAAAAPADTSTNDAVVPPAVAAAAPATPAVKPAFSLALKPKATPKKAVEPVAAADDGKPFVMALKAGPVKKEAKSNASNIALWNKKALELHEEEEVVVPTNAAMPKSGQPFKRSQVLNRLCRFVFVF
jgi:hypothetical protein